MIMEGIDIKEWYTISLSSVQTLNRIGWSEDHKMSYVTTSALHIMELNPSPSFTSSDMNLKRSVIKPPDNTPTAGSGIDINSLMFHLDQRDMYRVVLDTKLAPKLNDAKSPEPHFADVCWSPAGMFQEQRCMIATLTNYGCLNLYVSYFNCWIDIANLSEEWSHHCVSKWEGESLPESLADKFEILQRRVSQLKINAMVWANQVLGSEKGRHSLMATVSHSGTLALWKVPHVQDLTHVSEQYKPILMSTHETDMYCVTALHWIWWNGKKFSVAVGNLHGCAKILTFLVEDNSVYLVSIKDVWDNKDRMQVACIKSLPVSSLHAENERVIAVSKNNYFLVFLISEEGVRACCHDLVGNMTITGLEVMDEQTFLVCTLPGYISLYSVRINNSCEKPELILESKTLKSNITWHDMSCFGVTKSPYTNLWALGMSVCKLYDHLIIRRPSQILLMSLRDLPDPVEQLNNSIMSPRYIWESLELLRLEYVKHQEPPSLPYLERCNELETLSTSQLQIELWRARMVLAQVVASNTTTRHPETCAFVALLEELILGRHACKCIQELVERHKQEPLQEESLISLGLLRAWLQVWLSQITVNSDDEKIEQLQVDTLKCMKEEAAKKENVVVECGISENAEANSINRSDPSTATMNLSTDDPDIDETSSSSESNSVSSSFSGKMPSQVQVAKVCSSFLKVELHATRQEVTRVLALPIIPGTSDKEVCEFCQQEVPMVSNWRTGTCPANHRLPRCCLCLRRCRRIPQRLCVTCPTVACPDDNTDHGLDLHCTLCDSPLLVDEKFKPPPQFKCPPADVPLHSGHGHGHGHGTAFIAEADIKADVVAEEESMEFDA